MRYVLDALITPTALMAQAASSFRFFIPHGQHMAQRTRPQLGRLVQLIRRARPTRPPVLWDDVEATGVGYCPFLTYDGAGAGVIDGVEISSDLAQCRVRGRVISGEEIKHCHHLACNGAQRISEAGLL
ncbi:hypothetical protein FN846DRAFT_950069 [Sphaerosporella brunnea]|uniref:Uncharacterized protein n=1 Tax=Sphaerosporella brunnea TaxID=1250544 RepID=A0A5J5EXQ7_9PEZI|nr:hypothetical protein FN846DRAFT_950069 [Sphaerosporella brunnea]